MIGRLVRSVDFERVLRSPTRAKSVHFAVHHVAGAPGTPDVPVIPPGSPELSTGQASVPFSAVDDCPAAVSVSPAGAAPPNALWLGAVVPKRHARRAVTRSLIKRQIRAVVDLQQANLADGMWVVRLRQPFERTRFASAASSALKHAVRCELVQLLGLSVRRAPLA